jgi:DNA-binding protein HU-beta
VLAAIFDPGDGLIAEALRRGERVALAGFGSFDVQRRPERKGRNPRTGKELTIPARNVCTFKPRKGLRSSMKDMVGA